MIALSQLDAEINQTCHSKRKLPLADTRPNQPKDQRCFSGIFKDERWNQLRAVFMAPLSAKYCSFVAATAKTDDLQVCL